MKQTEHPGEAEAPALPGRVLLTVLCRRCGYNLRGVEAGGKCPECGDEAWPSIRPLIDISRERFALLHRPRHLALALVAVPLSLLISAGLCWAPYLEAVVRQIRSPGASLLSAPSRGRFAATMIAAGVALAATVVLRQPTGAPPPRSYRLGLRRGRAGVILWGGLLALLFAYDAAHPPQAQAWADLLQVDGSRSLIRLGLDAAVLFMLWGFLPIMRLLSVHSLPHRLGGASRQGFSALVAALLTVVAGDVGSLCVWGLDAAGVPARLLDPFGVIASMLILVGSAMLTLAVFNLTMDSMRLATNLYRPTRPVEQVVG